MGRNNSGQFKRNRNILLRTVRFCYICGQPLDKTQLYYVYDADGFKRINPEAVTVDHVKAYVDTQDDSLANLRLAHARCNMSKNKRPHADILKRGRTIA